MSSDTSDIKVTPGLHAQRRDAEARREAAVERIEALTRDRNAAAADLVAGVAGAQKRLEAAETAIVAARRDEERLSAAIVEIERRQRESEQQARESQRSALADEHAAKVAERDRLFGAIAEQMGAMVPLIRQATALGDELHNLAIRLRWNSPESYSRGGRLRLATYLLTQLSVEAGLRPHIEAPWPEQRQPLIDPAVIALASQPVPAGRRRITTPDGSIIEVDIDEEDEDDA
jgi:hypothetical protein